MPESDADRIRREAEAEAAKQRKKDLEKIADESKNDRRRER